MEGDLWPVLYRLIYEEDNRRPRKKGVQYSDGRILEVYCWAVIHDRPTSWSCEANNWPPRRRWQPLPCDATMSVRLRTLSLRQLLASVLDGLAEAYPHRATALSRLLSVKMMDAKPLAVGAYSKDQDARWGQVSEKAKARTRLQALLRLGRRPAGALVPDVWTLGAMNLADPEAAATMLVPRLRGDGYLLGDASHDSNPLHQACERLEESGGGREAATAGPAEEAGYGPGPPRSSPGSGAKPGDDRVAGVAGKDAPSPFAKALYAMRTDIERRLGNCTGFGGGGLQPLPSWVRRPHRAWRCGSR